MTTTTAVRPTSCSGQTRRETGTQSQGSQVDRPAAGTQAAGFTSEVYLEMKANLRRLIPATVAMLSMALALGAGMRW